MEELQVLIGMVSDLPQMAIWVLVLFFAYKVICVGSVFSVVRLAINSANSYFSGTDERLKKKNLSSQNIITHDGTFDELKLQIKRIHGVSSHSSSHIHSQDVVWLKEAIDEKKAKEKKTT